MHYTWFELSQIQQQNEKLSQIEDNGKGLSQIVSEASKFFAQMLFEKIIEQMS